MVRNLVKKPKIKTCRICKAKFEPPSYRPLTATCSFECTVAHGLQILAKNKVTKEREQAKAHRAAKAAIKPLKWHLDLAQVWVNRFIRLRDANLGCISCGTTKPDIQYAAGHFRSRGAASQHRYSHDNLALQCNKHCNLMLSGNHANYRIGLIARIGLDRVEKLENDNTPHKWTVDEAKEIIAKHKKLIKELDVSRELR